MPVDQGEVQPDAERWQPACPLHRVGHRRRAHHQAGRREDAAAMSFLDRLVDRYGGAKVVGRDDQLFQVDVLLLRVMVASCREETCSSMTVCIRYWRVITGPGKGDMGGGRSWVVSLIGLKGRRWFQSVLRLHFVRSKPVADAVRMAG